MITEAERTDARRHMGYPAQGVARPVGDDASRRVEFMRLFAFSYSTLSGAGYGGLSAANEFASIAASLEAMTGQIYLAVVIARLVGVQAAAPRGGEP